MKICAYCSELKVEEHSEIRPDAKKKLLFPDGQRLAFYQVCFACNHVRLAWQQKIDAEKIRLADFRRQWHLDVAERNAKKRAEIDARNAEREKKRAEIEAEREDSREKREAAERASALAKMAKLEAELDALRKKYSTSDDKNTWHRQNKMLRIKPC